MGQELKLTDTDGPSSSDVVGNQSAMYHDVPLDETISDEENTSSDGEKDTFSDVEENISSDEENTSSGEKNTSSGGNEDENEDLDMDINKETIYSELEANLFYHSKVKAMRDKLLNGYKVPLDPPHSPPIHQTLTRSGELTLEHYVA